MHHHLTHRTSGAVVNVNGLGRMKLFRVSFLLPCLQHFGQSLRFHRLLIFHHPFGHCTTWLIVFPIASGYVFICPSPLMICLLVPSFHCMLVSMGKMMI